MKMNIFMNKNTSVSIRTETLEGVEYTVVPVVMMVEGVHSGSGGSLYYSSEELNAFHPAWNGVPVSIQHPTNESGMPVSCNAPNFYETQVVGKIFNTYFEDDKLKAEAWIKNEKVERVAPGLLAHLKEGLPLEVSTGLYSEDIESHGIWRNEEYTAIATKIRPDHLALLPGGTGACSWVDGCGVRANKREVKTMKRFKKEKILIIDDVLKGNETDYTELMDKMYAKIDNMDVQGVRYNYVRKIFSDYVIYKSHNRETGVEKFYKRNYSLNTSGEIEWTTDPVEVLENISYSEINNNKKGEEEMKLMKDCCPKQVDALIQANSNFTEDDKDLLLNLTEDAFNKMIEVSKPIKDNSVVQERIETIEDVKKTPLLSDELKKGILYANSLLIETKKALIEKLKGNEQCKFNEEDLNTFEIPFLQKLVDSICVETGETVVVHTASGAAPVTTNEEAPLPDPDSYFKEDK